MFDLDFSAYLRKVPPRIYPRVSQYLNTIRSQQEQAILRASHVTSETSGARLLTALLNTSDVTNLDSYKDPWSYVTGNLDSFTRSLGRELDPAQTGLIKRNLFISSPTPCTEILFPVSRFDPYSYLPIGKSYYDGWYDLKPLRLVELTDSELTFQFQGDMLAYRNSGPALAIFGLDVIALILKYLAYRATLPDDVDRMYATRQFIHQEVLLPCFIQDSVALWLRNTYRHVFLDALPHFNYFDVQWVSANAGVLGAEYNAMITDLRDLRRQLQNKTIDVDTVTNSLLLSPDKTSFRDWYLDLELQTPVPLQQQYAWLDGLKSFNWMSFVYGLGVCGGRTNTFLSFQRRTRRDMEIWEGLHPSSYIHDVYCRDYLQNQIRQFDDVLALT